MEENINTTQEQSEQAAQEKSADNNEQGRDVREAFAQISPEYKKYILIIVVSAFIVMFLIKIIKRFML
jgi:hypothetical protein